MPDSIPSPARGARSLLRPFMWRAVAFVLVFLAAFVALVTGVEVTQRDLATAGVAEKAYYALGLFVLGGLDIGIPAGGPVAGRLVLWGTYFMAPALTASALLEAAVRLMGPLALRVRPLGGHVVVAGAGRLTVLYIRKLRERDPGRTVVVVERDPAHPRLSALRDLQGAVVVSGDITNDAVLRAVRVERAHRVVLLAGEDFANLDAASKILGLAPDLSGRLVAHVSDLSFMRETARSSVARHCEIFNSHEFAAIHLVQEQLLDRFHSTEHRDLVVLAGFGRFGQTVLHQLQQRALGSFGHVLIIDECAGRNARAFEEEPGFADEYGRQIIDGDLLDPDIWSRVGAVVRSEGHDPVVVVGSGDDGTNLHVALTVRKRYPDAYIVARSSSASPFTGEIAREAGIRAINLAELVESRMPESWF